MGEQLRKDTLPAFNGAMETGFVLPALKDVTISVLFKKGEKSKCDNYRGISIINHDGKLLERLIQNRLLPYVQELGCIPDSQCGFLPGRSTVDAVLVSRLVSTFALEKDVPLYKCFIDLTKAYDKVDRNTLWKILHRIGVPPKILKVIVNLHEGAMARVRLEGQSSEDFELKRGLKQRSVFAPLLFNIFFGAIINAFHKECEKENRLDLGLKFDGNWQNNFVMNKFIKQRQSSRNRRGGGVNHTSAFSFKLFEILFADDCELFAESEEALQMMINIFVRIAKAFAQEVSVKKTKVVVVERKRADIAEDRPAPVICIEGTTLEVLSDFVYLGSKEASSGTMDVEVNVRVQRMHAAFAEWSGRILMNKCLSMELRLKFFTLMVVSNGVYGCATWNLCAKHVRKLDSAQFQLLKKLFGIKHSHHQISYVEILRMADQAGCPILPLECKIEKLQLRYLGHVERMGDGRLQKQIMYSCLNIGNVCSNRLGAPAQNYRIVIVDALKKFGYSPGSWREAAADRTAWRHQLNSTGQDACLEKWLRKRESQQLLRHARQQRNWTLWPRMKMT
jgi:hypothetical protein